jgi:hypothetical protein
VLFAISMAITSINIFATKRFVFYQGEQKR